MSMRFLVILFLSLVACQGQDAGDTASAAPAAEPTEPRPQNRGPLPCNGSLALCAKRYNEVAYATTHNGMSNKDEGWQLPNQIHGIGDQLADGVRAMMLDTHMYNEEPYLCHGICAAGKRPLLDALIEIRQFLDDNPGEVFTFLYQDGISTERTQAVMRESGLWQMTLAHTLGEPWPTLGEMLASNQRVVAFAEGEGGSEGKYLHMWDFVWDTRYAHASIEAFDCTLNRGRQGNDLFLINHWLYDIPDASNAAEVNSEAVLGQRVEACSAEGGQFPNYIAVNFYSLGDLMAVVNRLNASAVE